MKSLLSKNIEVNPRGIANVTTLTDSQIKNGLKQIADFESAVDWWSGDLLAELSRRNPEAIEPDNVQQMEFEFVQYLSACEVARKIPIDHRDLNLSFAHHREIAKECDSLQEIDQWLKRATKENWSLPQLRKQLRSRHIDTSKAGKITGNFSWLTPLINAAARIINKPLKSFSGAEKKALQEALSPLVDLYSKLSK